MFAALKAGGGYTVKLLEFPRHHSGSREAQRVGNLLDGTAFAKKRPRRNHAFVAQPFFGIDTNPTVEQAPEMTL